MKEEGDVMYHKYDTCPASLSAYLISHFTSRCEEGRSEGRGCHSLAAIENNRQRIS